MSLHSATDPQVSAVMALLMGGINSDLRDTLGEKAVHATYGWPLRTDAVPSMKIPALWVYRGGPNRWEQATTKHTHRVCKLHVDYVAPPGNWLKLDQLWPLLESVNAKIVELMRAGKHAAVSGGAEVLSAAGFVAPPRYATMRDQQRFLPSNDSSYPVLQSEMDIVHREEVDISALQGLIDLRATYNLITDGEADYEIVVDDTPDGART